MILRYICCLLLLLSYTNSIAQQSKSFIVKVRVVDEKNNTPVKNAEIQVNSSIVNFADIDGVYKIRAQVSDQLTVRHPDFETVRYTIKSDEDIKIIIKDLPRRREKSFFSLSKRQTDNYQILIDSAKLYKKKDIDKSLCFIEDALKSNQSKKRNANTYKVLADVYLHWKQYDIAITNYKISLQINAKIATLLQLAKTQYLAKKYNESEASYNQLQKRDLSNYEKIRVFEGLGDVLLAKNKYKEAKVNYEKGLEVAETTSIEEEIPDLNAKIANVYAKEGKIGKANSAFSNTLKIAAELPKKKSLKVQQEVADFYNKTRQYDDEIKLRKEILENVDDESYAEERVEGINKSNDVEKNNDSLTSQKLNYKIGNAYVLKEEYPEAIQYLEKSIKEAGKKEDLEVKKYATRKLSEVYATVGSYIKALRTYRDYVEIVDSSYIRKEQEIYQIKRLTKKIADSQSRIAILEKDRQISESKINIAYKDKELTVERSKRQQLIIYSLLLGLVLMSLLTYYSLRANQKQKLANNLLALKSMRSQMNPHFIFNALNSVNSFIAVNDERNANRYLSEFSALMRSVLENSEEDFIPFQKEIELLGLYVKLEHNRFKDKFDYTIDVDKTIDLESYAIPPMLLQPYIENAIWHGLRYKKEKGILNISIAKKHENSITITVQDNGIGRKRSMEMKTKNQLKQKSKGMSTIKNRIAILNDMYQDKIAVEITDAFVDGTGTKVTLTLKK